jgi:hypothetical protein
LIRHGRRAAYVTGLPSRRRGVPAPSRGPGAFEMADTSRSVENVPACRGPRATSGMRIPAKPALHRGQSRTIGEDSRHALRDLAPAPHVPAAARNRGGQTRGTTMVAQRGRIRKEKTSGTVCFALSTHNTHTLSSFADDMPRPASGHALPCDRAYYVTRSTSNHALAG